MAELAGAGLALGLIGTAGQTFANIQASQAQARAALAEAESERQAAVGFERDSRRRARLLAGQARATMAASGLDLASGSPLFLDLENARQAEIEAQDIRRLGQIQASGKEFQARLARAQIPGQVLGGVGQAGSLLSLFALRRS